MSDDIWKKSFLFILISVNLTIILLIIFMVSYRKKMVDKSRKILSDTSKSSSKFQHSKSSIDVFKDNVLSNKSTGLAISKIRYSLRDRPLEPPKSKQKQHKKVVKLKAIASIKKIKQIQYSSNIEDSDILLPNGSVIRSDIAKNDDTLFPKVRSISQYLMKPGKSTEL